MKRINPIKLLKYFLVASSILSTDWSANSLKCELPENCKTIIEQKEPAIIRKDWAISSISASCRDNFWNVHRFLSDELRWHKNEKIEFVIWEEKKIKCKQINK